jgi:hypothetical protein
MPKILVFGEIPPWLVKYGCAPIALISLQGLVAAVKKHQPALVFIQVGIQLGQVRQALQGLPRGLAGAPPPLTLCVADLADHPVLAALPNVTVVAPKADLIPVLFRLGVLQEPTMPPRFAPSPSPPPVLLPLLQAEPASRARTQPREGVEVVHGTQAVMITLPKKHAQLLRFLLKTPGVFQPCEQLMSQAQLNSVGSLKSYLSAINRELPRWARIRGSQAQYAVVFSP